MKEAKGREGSRGRRKAACGTRDTTGDKWNQKEAGSRARASTNDNTREVGGYTEEREECD